MNDSQHLILVVRRDLTSWSFPLRARPLLRLDHVTHGFAQLSQNPPSAANPHPSLSILLLPGAKFTYHPTHIPSSYGLCGTGDLHCFISPYQKLQSFSYSSSSNSLTSQEKPPVRNCTLYDHKEPRQRMQSQQFVKRSTDSSVYLQKRYQALKS